MVATRPTVTSDMTTRSQPATSRPFTVVLCAACRTHGDADVMAALRATVRRCRHGILVSSACMFGPLTCASRPHGPGSMVLFQPCSSDRTPSGPTRWIGPVNDVDDVTELCSWLELGQWDYGILPARLRAERYGVAAAGRN